MKRVSVFVVVVGMLGGLAAPGIHAETDAQLFANLGIITDDSFKFNDFFWNLGLNLDLTLNDLLILSPELNLVTYKFKFKAFLLEPAILLNLKFSENFFAGGGISKFMVISEGDYLGSSEWAMKLNIGFIGEYFKFRIYLSTPFDNVFKDNLIGLQFGISF